MTGRYVASIHVPGRLPSHVAVFDKARQAWAHLAHRYGQRDTVSGQVMAQMIWLGRGAFRTDGHGKVIALDATGEATVYAVNLVCGHQTMSGTTGPAPAGSVLEPPSWSALCAGRRLPGSSWCGEHTTDCQHCGGPALNWGGAPDCGCRTNRPSTEGKRDL
ncbi:hypothetical protein GCM10010124_02030 [Pilimelia terevasa]|uniref:Uncharacterized protein n=1 Tax=Pilimelia terevasa TaxID=53372 RepID=A0A8J3BD98_9ACTN|nr:hypothetical protein [Pilimelia terevasa]GGK13088.1 hypothetical protein GCM10010124_02030 [Pilimelia terevasa]